MQQQDETAFMTATEDSGRRSSKKEDTESAIQNDVRNKSNKRLSYKQQSTTKDHVLVIVGLAVLLLVLLVIVVPSSALQRTATQWPSCGLDPETARRRNCSFDIISFAWQMPECYDQELVKEFCGWRDWTFFADPARTTPTSLEEALKGEQDLYTNYEYHVVHCTFTYRQMQRAYEKGRIDDHLRSLEHTLHCQRMLLMNATEAARHFTIAEVIYPACSSV